MEEYEPVGKELRKIDFKDLQQTKTIATSGHEFCRAVSQPLIPL
jgi:hypothetical protein